MTKPLPFKRPKKAASSIAFHEFCLTVLGLKLTPGQMVLAKCIFGDVSPADLEGEERDIAMEILGGVLDIPASARKLVVLRLGRGSGKTTLSSAYAAFKSVTADVSFAGIGSIPIMVIVAPDKPTASISVNMVREMFRNHPALDRMVIRSTEFTVTISRPDNRLVTIQAIAPSRGGSSVRGRPILGFIMDEAEFFYSEEEGRVVNDKAIFDAMKPRLRGVGIFISTPWGTNSLMGELFEKNFGSPKFAMAARAPTELMRPDDPEIAKNIAADRLMNPENAAREYDCNTEAIGTGAFFDRVVVESSVDTTTGFPCGAHSSWPVVVACDFGFKQDSSTCAVVAHDGKFYRLLELIEMRPSPGKPLVPSVVVGEFARVAKMYGVSAVVSDGHYREAIREHLGSHGLGIIDAPEGMRGKQDVYTRTRAVLHEGRCRIPDHKKLIRQICEVTHKPVGGGNLRISSPRRAGSGHGDLVSVWTLGVYRLANRKPKEKEVVPEWGTAEYFHWVACKTLAKENRRERQYIRDTSEQIRRERKFRIS